MRSRSLTKTFLLLFIPAVASAEDTDWLVAPYGWLPAVSVDQTFDGDSGGGGGGGTGAEVLSKLDYAFMLRVEAARGRWGAMLDYITLSLSDGTRAELRFPPGASVDVATRLDVDVFELGGVYRLSADTRGLDLVLGWRRIDVDLGIVVGLQDLPPRTLPVAAKIDDAFLGARYQLPLGTRWDVSLRGDYGFGDSDGTVNLIAGIGVQINETFGMKFGYRHATIEFEEDVENSPETTELMLSGPFVGLLFRF